MLRPSVRLVVFCSHLPKISWFIITVLHIEKASELMSIRMGLQVCFVNWLGMDFDTVDGCEILHQLKTVVNIPW